MPNAIPGATYYDLVFDSKAVCNGIIEEDDEKMVVLEYDDIGETIHIPWSSFEDETLIVVKDLP